MGGFDLGKMSEADRASLERMHAASRTRKLKALRASAAGVSVLLVVGGIPPFVLMSVLHHVPLVLLLGSIVPGLALASFVFQKLGGDGHNPYS